jgi:uncharacterized protein
MSQRLRIGVDVDDVLVESLPVYVELFRRRFGREVKIEEAAWEIFRRFPDIPAEQMWGFYAELETTGFLATRPVYPEAVTGVRALAAAGHRLFVVTGRLAQHRDHTRRMLEGAGLLDVFEEVVHRDGESLAGYKPRVLREMGLELHIEDELEVARAVAAIPIPVLLFDRPWNQGEIPREVTRVRDWDRVVQRVSAEAAAREP